MGTRDVVDFIINVKYDKLPSNVVKQVKLAVRDTLGVTLAGYRDVASEAARNVAKASTSTPLSNALTAIRLCKSDRHVSPFACRLHSVLRILHFRRGLCPKNLLRH